MGGPSLFIQPTPMSNFKLSTGTLLGLAVLAASSVTWAQTTTAGTGTTATVTTTTATATNGHHNGQGANGILRDDLDLTDAQKAKIKSIDASHRATIEEIKTNGGLTDDQKKDAIKAEHQQMKSDIQAVLTPAQNAKLAQLEAQRKAQRKNISPKKAKKLAEAQAAQAPATTAPGTTTTTVTAAGTTTAPAQ